MSDCAGEGKLVKEVPYNARGRKMHMKVCPVCGREWRAQGRPNTTLRQAIPAHEVPAQRLRWTFVGAEPMGDRYGPVERETTEVNGVTIMRRRRPGTKGVTEYRVGRNTHRRLRDAVAEAKAEAHAGTRGEELSWAKVEEAMPRAKAIAYDGCHKIYLAMDEQQAREIREMGYGEQAPTLFQRVEDPAVALSTVRAWYLRSCGLQFVTAVSGAGNSEDFTDLVPQFEWPFFEDAEP